MNCSHCEEIVNPYKCCDCKAYVINECRECHLEACHGVFSAECGTDELELICKGRRLTERELREGTPDDDDVEVCDRELIDYNIPLTGAEAFGMEENDFNENVF